MLLSTRTISNQKIPQFQLTHANLMPYDFMTQVRPTFNFKKRGQRKKSTVLRPKRDVSAPASESYLRTTSAPCERHDFNRAAGECR